ncbi:MAG: hypothetical protein WAN86_23285 [Hyphomicrobiaceae bacterium]
MPRRTFEKGSTVRGSRIDCDDYRMLTYLRNALAHGNRPPDAEVQRIAADAERLKAALTRLIVALSA